MQGHRGKHQLESESRRGAKGMEPRAFIEVFIGRKG